MPAAKLPHGNTRSCVAADVLGAFATDPRLNPAAVEHLALLAADTDLSYGDAPDVYHMEDGGDPSKVDTCVVHAFGEIDNLTSDERDALSAWVINMSTLIAPAKYQVLPHYEEHHDPITGRLSHVGCSCVGLLTRAIEAAVTDPVNQSRPLAHGTTGYPDTDLATLKQIYRPGLLRYRALVGLAGLGPWKVVLPGHLLHAIGKGRASWPYTPTSGDYSFP